MCYMEEERWKQVHWCRRRTQRDSALSTRRCQPRWSSQWCKIPLMPLTCMAILHSSSAYNPSSPLINTSWLLNYFNLSLLIYIQRYIEIEKINIVRFLQVGYIYIFKMMKREIECVTLEGMVKLFCSNSSDPIT